MKQPKQFPEWIQRTIQGAVFAMFAWYIIDGLYRMLNEITFHHHGG